MKKFDTLESEEFKSVGLYRSNSSQFAAFNEFARGKANDPFIAIQVKLHVAAGHIETFKRALDGYPGTQDHPAPLFEANTKEHMIRIIYDKVAEEKTP